MLLFLRLIGGKFISRIMGFFGWLAQDWRRVVIAVLAVLSVILFIRGNGLADDRDKALEGWKAETAAHKQTEANYRAASAKALADAKANKVRVETKYVEIENAQDKDIRARLAAATASLRARAASSDSSRADAISLPSVAVPTIDPIGASGEPVVDDALICTANTVKAQGWQDWYKEAQAVTRQ
jgi:hypothetical protein